MKKIIVMLLAVMLLIPVGVSAAALPTKVYVDDELLKFQNNPIQTSGTTLVEFTTVFKALGLEYKWEQSTKTVYGWNDYIDLKLTIGSKTAVVNDEKISLLVAPKVVNGKTFVPLRFISESTGADVAWNKDSNTVTITSFSIPVYFDEPTLNDAVWGMSMNDTKKAVYGEVDGETADDHIYYSYIDVAGYAAIADLQFFNGKLGQATYVIDEEITDKMDYVFINYDIYSELEYVFGEPSVDVEIWNDESKETEDIDKYGDLIASGALTLVTVWQLEDTEIILSSDVDSEGNPMIYLIATGTNYTDSIYGE